MAPVTSAPQASRRDPDTNHRRDACATTEGDRVMLNRLLLGALLSVLTLSPTLLAEEGKEAKVEGKHGCFEMRTYTANEGKLDALQARFRDHTNALFLKH